MLTALAKADKFSEWLLLRREVCGFGSWESLAEKIKKPGIATIYRILADDPADPETRLGSRNQFAFGLGFNGWRDLVSAWRVGDVDRGFETIEIDVPTAVAVIVQDAKRVRDAADAAGITAEMANRFLTMLSISARVSPHKDAFGRPRVPRKKSS